MTGYDTELNYRRASVEGASAVGLVVILHDILVGDLNKTIESIHAGNIEERSRHIKHALLVLQQLEGSLDSPKGKELADSLTSFYSYLRGKLMEAHCKVSDSILRHMIELVLDVRQTWQSVDRSEVSASRNRSAGYDATGSSGSEAVLSSSWSA